MGLQFYNAKMVQSIVFNGKICSLATPRVMAILNVTPNSFYVSSRKNDEKSLVEAAEKALNDGATVLDVGGCSTRPGADFASFDDEWQRVEWALQVLRTYFSDAAVSIDTFRAEVARRAVNQFGVAMVNDVSAGEIDAEMLPTVARLQVPYVLTNCEKIGDNQHFMSEILRFFARKIEQLRSLGFDKEIVIDPGFGFGKTLEQNWELLRQLSVLKTFDLPILVGLSRKSMIWKPLGISPDEALQGTIEANKLALQGGASILRVHDVKEAVDLI